MKINLYILSNFIIISLANCQTLRSPKSVITKWRNADLMLFAWNEDTIHSCMFAVSNDKSFLYSIIQNDSSKVKLECRGRLAASASLDTLFLDYYNHNKPVNFKPYLVREVSGTYFIQFLENSPMQIFLRKQRLAHRF